MISIKLSTGDTLVVDSGWDSGTHTGFNVSSINDKYNSKTLDKLISKDDIKGLEYLISYTVQQYLKEKQHAT